MNCAEYTAVNYQDGMLPLSELIQEYHIFWPLIFLVRWQLPDTAKFAIRYGIINIDTVIGKLAMGAWQNETIDPVWIDCYYAMWLDNILAGIIIAAGLYITTKIAFVLVQTIIQACILTWYTYTALGYMSLTVEQSVATAGLDKKRI